MLTQGLACWLAKTYDPWKPFLPSAWLRVQVQLNPITPITSPGIYTALVGDVAWYIHTSRVSPCIRCWLCYSWGGRRWRVEMLYQVLTMLPLGREEMEGRDGGLRWRVVEEPGSLRAGRGWRSLARGGRSWGCYNTERFDLLTRCWGFHLCLILS